MSEVEALELAVHEKEQVCIPYLARVAETCLVLGTKAVSRKPYATYPLPVQNAAHLRQLLEAERLERERIVNDLRAQVLQLQEQAEFPLAELGALRAQMRNKQESWDKQKFELETQVRAQCTARLTWTRYYNQMRDDIITGASAVQICTITCFLSTQTTALTLSLIQTDRLMGMLRKMGLLADSEGHRVASAPSPLGAPDVTAVSAPTQLARWVGRWRGS